MALLEQTQQTMQQVSKISSLNPQLTYSYIIRDTFYQLVPTEFKQYYLYYVRLCMNWYQGYVPEFHDPRNGIFSTRIANSIVKELTKLIVGGKVFFGNKYLEKNPKDLVNPTLREFNEWSDMYSFQEFVKRLVEYTIAGGTAAIVMNINHDRDLVPKVLRIDQFFHQTNFTGEVVAYTGFIKSYTADITNGDGRDKTSNNYYLLETRGYNDKEQPFMKIVVKQGLSSVVSAQDFDPNEAITLDWEQLPKLIKRKIKHDYGDNFKIGVEVPISETIPNLGVIISKLSATNTIPEVDLGESALANVISYMIAYEQSFAEMITDLYLARGKVLLPQAMRNPTDPNNSYYSDLDGMLFTKMPYQGENEQKPISIQFELRAEEWTKIRNNLAESIASAIGVSGSDIFSFLRDATGSSKTATQIASEAQKTISYIEEKRAIFSQSLNTFIKIWKDYYNKEDEFEVKFSSQNHVNMLVTTEQVRVMNEIGFSDWDKFRYFFPDLDDAQVKEMVDRSFEQKKRLVDMQAESNMKSFENSVNKEQDKTGGRPKETVEQEQEEEIELKDENN